MKAKSVGSLRHQVAIYTTSDTRNDYGDAVEAGSLLATVWGRVEPLLGRELVAAQQIHAEVNHRVTVRYSSDLAAVGPKHYIVFDSRTFDIQSVLNLDERDRYLVFLCLERLTS